MVEEVTGNKKGGGEEWKNHFQHVYTPRSKGGGQEAMKLVGNVLHVNKKMQMSDAREL